MHCYLSNLSHFYGSSRNSWLNNCNISPERMGGVQVFWQLVRSRAWLWRMRRKIKWMDFAFPSIQVTPILTWMIPQLKFSLSCEFQVSEIIEQSQAFAGRLLPHGPVSIRVGAPQIWWDGIYCLWDWWKSQAPPPPIRKGNVALMPWYGEKSDLALGSGMFLVRLWWVGPGRGHMKGSLCQAAKMFSLGLMKTRTHGQTWEHACHTLHKHQELQQCGQYQCSSSSTKWKAW